jgi:hypothetical protein
MSSPATINLLSPVRNNYQRVGANVLRHFLRGIHLAKPDLSVSAVSAVVAVVAVVSIVSIVSIASIASIASTARRRVQLRCGRSVRIADATRQILHRGDSQQADHYDQQGVFHQILPFYLFPHSLQCVLKCAQHFASCNLLPGPYRTQDTGHKVISLPASEILEDRATRHYVVELS